MASCPPSPRTACHARARLPLIFTHPVFPLTRFSVPRSRCTGRRSHLHQGAGMPTELAGGLNQERIHWPGHHCYTGRAGSSVRRRLPPREIRACCRSWSRPDRWAAGRYTNRAAPQAAGVSAAAGPSAQWSGREDLNLRPHRPERCALPGCATPRRSPEYRRPSTDPGPFVSQSRPTKLT